MVVNITSNVPYLKEINGQFRISGNPSLKSFLNDLGVTWDQDALVTLNGKIGNGNELLQDNDQIRLLIPIAGG